MFPPQHIHGRKLKETPEGIVLEVLSSIHEKLQGKILT